MTSYFAEGLAASARANSLSERGVPTCITLSAEQPSTINYVMAVAAIPKALTASLLLMRTTAMWRLLQKVGKRLAHH